VRLFVDLRAQVATGDIIETTSGRRYQVLSARVQQRGDHRGRQHLECIVVPKNWPPPEHSAALTVHRIRWYARRRRGAKRGRR
jgi:hypothetical protein